MTTRALPRSLRRIGRPLAGALVAMLVASCDPKASSTAPGGGGGTTVDDVVPTIGAVANGANLDTVDVNTPLTVTVTGTDNRTLRRLDVTVQAGATQLVRDTSVNSAGGTTYARTITVRLTGVVAGTPIRVISQAADLAGNLSRIDTLRLVTRDTLSPVLQLFQPTLASAYQLGDTVKVDVVSSDGSGLVKVYSQLFRLTSPTDTVGVLQRTDSIAVAAGTTTLHSVFPIPYSLALPAGDYGVRVRAVDVSGNVTRLPQVAILLRDPTPPGLTVSLPGRDTTVTASDTNFIVTLRATDNIQVVGAKAWGVTYKGNPALGRVDTLLRFDTVAVPVANGGAFRPGLIDTTVSRRMIPVNHGSVDPETVSVFVRATDQSGNNATVQRRVFLKKALFTQDSIAPTFDTLNVVPGDLAAVTLGSNFTASAHVLDNFGLARLTVVGFTTKGDPNLGPVDTTIRYDSVFSPIKGSGPQAFRVGLIDTTVTRSMVANATTGGPDTLRLLFRVTDRSGRTTTLTRRVILLSGPTVTLGAPINGSTTFPGTRIPIQVSATGPSRLIELGYRIVNTNWVPNPAIKRVDVSGLNATTATIYDTVTVPAGVLAGSQIRVVPFARDVVNPGVTVLGDSSFVNVSVPTADVTGPLVYQSIPRRIETGDTLVIRASDPSGVSKIVSVLVNDATGLVFQSDSVLFSGTLPKDTALRARITIPLAALGVGYRLFSFAFDGVSPTPNKAYSVPGTSIQPDSIRADTVRGVMSFGRTFRTANLPTGAFAGDLIVDRGNNVYISNIGRNQLERWRLSDSTFQASIPVGSQPWGLTFNRTGDSIFVANSGGTNISVVDTATKGEKRRIKTPGNVLYVITQTIDPSSGVARLTLDNIVQYSDRPQYIAMSKNGNLYYSTRPTGTATPGTLRRVDPRQIPAATEVQQVTTYAALGPTNTFVIANVDSLYITKSLADSISDNVTVFERQYGTVSQITLPVTTGLGSYTLGATDSNVVRLCNVTLRAANGDCRALQVDVASLSLTDTTFLAAGGDGRAIAFAEGNVSGRAARVMLVIDTAGSWFNVVGSANTSVADLTNNASDRVFGLAVDSLSQTLLANGTSAFFADINASALFNLRLQGSYQTSLAGNGVAYHPKAVCSIGGSLQTRVAFVMQGDSSIAVVDCFAFRKFKTIPVRTALYGQIRAVLPTSGELLIDPTLSVKLYCLTKEGLLVIPIRTSDLP